MIAEEKEVATTEKKEPLETEEFDTERCFSPEVDIIEKQDNVVIMADMPGVSKDDVEATFEQGVLTINGRCQVEDRGDMTLERQEYGTGNYHRCFAIGEGLDPEGIEATMKSGLLRLVIPKSEQYQTRKIEIGGE